MAWQQLHLQCEKANVDFAEALLLEAGALSIALDDAGDQPLFEPLPGESPLWDEVILTGLFDATTEIGSRQAVEQLSHEIAAQVQAQALATSARREPTRKKGKRKRQQAKAKKEEKRTKQQRRIQMPCRRLPYAVCTLHAQ